MMQNLNKIKQKILYLQIKHFIQIYLKKWQILNFDFL